ncbi:precorrin-6A/cobalt-precorrin-6A reductase, partial [Rubrivivax gelatinosus]|uniref:precorrin-6A/cobalt-precorrin-6A reductase n=1 Tax=Rubrivivax gelatinosus TaxID=28068 RepID=UPI001ED8D2CA
MACATEDNLGCAERRTRGRTEAGQAVLAETDDRELGGTTEASRLAAAFARDGVEAVFSYAGRTAAPVAQPLPIRVGGFGGAEGLAAWLRAEGISHVV